jgi:hypothetical protein
VAGVLFEDIFDVKYINQESKKFDRVLLQVLFVLDKGMDDNDIDVDQEPLVSTVTAVKGKAVTKVKKPKKRKKKDEQKTKAANPFGQFLKHKRASDGKVDFKKACQEWADSSAENKDYYRKCYEEDKSALTARYRSPDSGNQSSESEKQSKSSRSKKGPKVKKLTEGTTSNLQLLLKVESLDSEIDQLNLEARNLTDLLCGEKVQLSINQFKHDEKITECSNFKEKFKILLSQHSSCLVGDLMKK